MSRLIRVSSVLTCIGLGLCLTAGCSSGSEEPGRDGVRESSPEGGQEAGASAPEFWVDPQSPAARQVTRWKDEGRDRDADLLRQISEQPAAVWPSGEDPGPSVRRATRGAEKDGSTAVLVAYNIPNRDCGQHSAGGAADAQTYRAWVDRFAEAVGESQALVVLEPDAVPHMVDGCTPAEYHAARSELIAGAIDRLKQQPGVRVYLDAGNPAWIDDPRKVAEPLRRAGVTRADGFALNVSNFQTDTTAKGYGKRLSELLDDAHYVVDTSRNGNGPLSGDRAETWCNPPGRALGTPPTTRTGDELLDAYLWVKRPGESDGTCRGGPTAGTWWPDYALGLARNTRA